MTVVMMITMMVIMVLMMMEMTWVRMNFDYEDGGNCGDTTGDGDDDDADKYDAET